MLDVNSTAEVDDRNAAFLFGRWETGLPDSWVPMSLEELEPGPELAALLSAIEVDTLSGFDRVRVLRAHRRMATHYEAQAYRDMALIDEALDHHNREPDAQVGLATEAEVRAALAWTRRRTEVELGFALDLANRLPAVHERLVTGHLEVSKAKVIVSETTHLSDIDAQAVAASILDSAPGLTTGELRVMLKRQAAEIDPDEAARRLAEAFERRHVEVRATDAGAGTIVGRNLSPIDAQAINRRIHHLARAARSADDERTAAQLRADVFVDLLMGRSGVAASVTGPSGDAAGSAAGPPAKPPVTPAGSVEVRVDLTTLARLDDAPGDLAGFGPVVADIARQIAEEQARGASWTYSATDPETGSVISTGPIRRRPTAHTARRVRALRPVCIFPGCRMPASDCDLDHTEAWADGGLTEEGNLASLCRHDHRIKGEAGWRYSVDTDGDIAWTSPLGHRYRKNRPPP